jgi:hypothetical protein
MSFLRITQQPHHARIVRVMQPFWGRNNEGYSECPFLTGEMAHAVVSGMQGDDERYLQVTAQTCMRAKTPSFCTRAHTW